MIRFFAEAGLFTIARMSGCRRILTENRGVTAIEYAIIAGVITVAIVTGMKTMGPNLVTIFNNAGAEL